MKNLNILLALAITLFSCNNEPQPAATGAAPGPATLQPAAAAPAADLAGAGTVLQNAKTTQEEIKSLRKQVDALPEAAKKSNADNVANLRSTLEGIEEKHAYFIRELETALAASDTNAAGSTAPGAMATDKTAVIQEAVQSLKGYAEELKQVKRQVEDLSKK